MGNSSEITIEVVVEENFERILPLIADYQIFYEATPNSDKNRAHFSQFLKNHSLGIQFGAFDIKGEALGFATLYFIPASVEVGKTCLMNDLFVMAEKRGLGIARLLIEKCRDYSKQNGFLNVEWHTETKNKIAQKLYDKMGAKRSSWYIYNLDSK
jgi:GNAT superfamily N-acetyltransferase